MAELDELESQYQYQSTAGPVLEIFMHRKLPILIPGKRHAEFLFNLNNVQNRVQGTDF